MLRQGGVRAGNQAEIVRAIEAFRTHHAGASGDLLYRARTANPPAWQALLDQVEWKLIEMPIPRLQISGGGEDRFLYEYGWDQQVTRGQVAVADGLSGPMCLNVNIPVRRIRGVKITRQGGSSHFPHFNSLDAHPNGNSSDTLQNGERPMVAAEPARNSEITFDYEAIRDQYVSITPLQRDQTDYPAVQALTQNAPKLFQGMRFSRLGLIGFKN